MDDSSEFDLFVSYAQADRAWVHGYLLDALAQAGVRCLTEMEFALGAPRLIELERAVRASPRTLLILSPAYLAAELTQFTELLAHHYGAETATWPVIPLLLSPCKLPPRLAILGLLDVTDPATRHAVIEQLCKQLQRPVPRITPKPSCPYPGMLPFAEADAGRFFGREDDIEELVARLRLHPFQAVIGPSGSGKSSLVFAGLIPALKRSGLFPGGWAVSAMRPGATPLMTLRQTLGVSAPLSDLALSSPFLPEKEASAVPPLAEKGAGEGILLVVDQFEELFTQARGSPEAASFQQELLRLADTPGYALILIARADFYPDLMTGPLWRKIQAHRYEVLPLEATGLRKAIVQPAEDVGVYVEAALVERLVGDAAGEPGVLPFVQETLKLLWEKLERRFLPLRAYEALVLSRRTYGETPLTGLQVAMARRADEALAALTPTQQVVARRILLRLVHFGEGRADTRRQQSVSALHSNGEDPVEFDRVLAHLVTARLLTLSGDQTDGNRKADLAHEALIRGWPTLAGWAADRREAELARRRLEAKVAEWVRFGRSEGGLLDATELAEADAWLASPSAADLGRDSDLLTLVKASQTALNPGWHRLGMVWLSLAVVASAAVLAGIGFWLQINRSPASGLLALIVFLVVLIVSTVWAFVQLRRADRHFLQRWSHVIAHSGRLRAAIGASAAAVATFWALGGWQVLRAESICEQQGYGRQMSAIPVVVVNRNADPLGVEYFARMLNKVSNSYYQARVATREEAALCRRFVEYRIELTSERATDRPERSYTAVVYRSSDGRQEGAPITIFGPNTCGYYQVLAYQVGINYGVTSAKTDMGIGIPGPDSCQLLLLNEDGYAALRERRWQDAEQALTRAIAGDPDFAWAHVNLGELYYSTGRYAEAIAEMRQANQLAKRAYAPFLRQQAIACYRGKDYPCAVDANRQAMTADAADWVPVNNLAVVYRAMGEYAQAGQAFDQAATLVATTADAATRQSYERILTKNRGILAFLAGEPAEAIALLQRVDQIGWEFEEETVYYLARVYEEMADTTRACVYWQRYERLKPSFLHEEAERRAFAAAHLSALHCKP